jgi:hypothetical protein
MLEDKRQCEKPKVEVKKRIPESRTEAELEFDG